MALSAWFLACGSVAGACILNPQPQPPAETVDAGAANGGGSGSSSGGNSSTTTPSVSDAAASLDAMFGEVDGARGAGGEGATSAADALAEAGADVSSEDSIRPDSGSDACDAPGDGGMPWEGGGE